MKTGLCNWSAFKVYPGKGIRYVRADSKVMVFINKKSRASYMRKGNPRKCAWTAVYRRIHHKGQLAGASKKKKTRRASKKSRDSRYCGCVGSAVEEEESESAVGQNETTCCERCQRRWCQKEQRCQKSDHQAETRCQKSESRDQKINTRTRKK